ncbi:MAG: L-Ala-D/L-Glu epimerase [Phycisphaerae bacterium]|nr:L-Ala-D/L-Glu epimerase [Phycisphaerae bacterium]
MKLRYRRVTLPLLHPFTIATGTSTERNDVLVAVEHGGVVGCGEAAPSRGYGQSADSVVEALPRLAAALGDDPFAFEVNADRLLAAARGQYAAVAAIDGALHDLAGRLAGLPTWRRLGVSPGRMPVTSFTIGIDEIGVIERKVAEAAAWPLLKIKLGTPDDERIIQAVRRCTDAPLRVDANMGWDLERARQMCRFLADHNVEMVEQPLPRGQEDQLADLHADSPLPIYVDESCHHAADVVRLAGCVDGVNLKLSKAGGVTAGLRFIHAARAAGLKVMIGCMVQSSVGIAAGAQLAPLCDLADLDGHVLLARDAATGLDCRDGRLLLTDAPGQGVTLRDDLADPSGWTVVQ